MKRSLTFFVAAAALTSLLMFSALNASATDRAGKPAFNSAPTDYCTQTGGAVKVRRPAYGTNGGHPLPLSGLRQFCTYTADDTSRIHVLVDTLFTPMPTLASLAYYAQVQPLGNCSGNPASCYCSQLGGSDLFGGINAAGGGWVLKGDIDETLEACIFPDQSSIDSWGLFYHSAGIVRGIDLSTVLVYQNPF